MASGLGAAFLCRNRVLRFRVHHRCLRRALRLGIGRNDEDDETDIPSALMVVSFDLGVGIE